MRSKRPSSRNVRKCDKKEKSVKGIVYKEELVKMQKVIYKER